MRMKFSALKLVVFASIMLLSTAVLPAEKSDNEKVVKDGLLVSLQYTLFGEDGNLIESNKGKEPLQYVQGKNMLVPGLEKELAGMKIGQEKHVKVTPEEGYGQIDPRRFQEIPKDKIPREDLNKIKPGTMIPLATPNGQTYHFPVSEVKEKTIVVNLNHPMAGKTLVFDVKVLDIQPAPPPPPPQTSQPSPPTAPAKPAAPK